MIGRILTRYQLLEEVGHGGMAVVYRGTDTALGREVAVKVLHPHLANDAESRARLEREAQAVAKLHHDNISKIYDYSDHNSPIVSGHGVHSRTDADRISRRAPRRVARDRGDDRLGSGRRT